MILVTIFEAEVGVDQNCRCAWKFVPDDRVINLYFYLLIVDVISFFKLEEHVRGKEFDCDIEISHLFGVPASQIFEL